jgi:hypothetical protein
VDVVGTKTELLNYNKDSITLNDIIKVLDDNTLPADSVDPDDYVSHATTFYRLVENENKERIFEYVGKIGPYYTEAEINAQHNQLITGNVDFQGTKTFTTIRTSTTPTDNTDLTNKSYVDTSIQTEKDRAEQQEGIITTNLETEVSRATEAETNLQAELDLTNQGLEAVSRQVRVYDYLTANTDGTPVELSKLDTSYRINAISAKGLPADTYKVEIDSSVKVNDEDPIFEIGNAITLYQTGSNEDIKSDKYAYDTVNFLTNKLERHCKVITLGELASNTTNSD